MKIIHSCAKCGFEPDADRVEQQSGDPGAPQAGDYWLCRVCGFIHVYRQVSDHLVTGVPTGFELLDAMVALPAMFEKRNEILAERSGRRPS